MGLITQNVDRLHHESGSHKVVELHGRGDMLECQTCGAERSRVEYQQDLFIQNEAWLANLPDRSYQSTADGDAIISDSVSTKDFSVLRCEQCQVGIMKPSYVFFGGKVPREVVQQADGLINASKLLLVIGTTSTTYSCFRLIKQAHSIGSQVLIVNQGPTRADPLATGFYSHESCGYFLAELTKELGVPLPDPHRSLQAAH